jgi:hypothetical protein
MKPVGSTVLVAISLLSMSVVYALPPPTFVSKWGSRGTGDGQFNSPKALATHADSALGEIFVYVLDRNNNRVQKFTEPLYTPFPALTSKGLFALGSALMLTGSVFLFLRSRSLA